MKDARSEVLGNELYKLSASKNKDKNELGAAEQKEVFKYYLTNNTNTDKAENYLVTPYVAVNTTDINDALKIITTGGHHMLIEPHLVEAVPVLSKYYGGNYNGSGIKISDSTDTITSVDHHYLVTAFISRCYDGKSQTTSVI
ncbi:MULTISPECIES: hypothetical protein [Carnobacterium]|uniref:hypothetical protein n=1 Tax=Carnobacterium TaxID=2747 RepID=UPI00107248BC|nr:MULTISPECIES: hypothetical protein [Carnobacterium]MDT1940668.1 hypothetical protein [Carnobacterium divergens]MDT1943106.1 hypothetical protein [Carnobacterium divergens]MDT1948913.1 hypothetical protein [Carnobacterium divergens]MDT1951394.1 hypothetical protein [Carnobacterium divergens]MDT1956451.1 hypothetical protein [Carnobacterium divergens]